MRRQALHESWLLRFLAATPRNRWRDYAMCKDTDVDLWFPTNNTGSSMNETICAECPVRMDCGAEAAQEELGQPYVYGIRGGLGPEIRRSLLKRSRKYAS